MAAMTLEVPSASGRTSESIRWRRMNSPSREAFRSDTPQRVRRVSGRLRVRLDRSRSQPLEPRGAGVGELISVHVIPRPHSNLEDVLPIGKAAK